MANSNYAVLAPHILYPGDGGDLIPEHLKENALKERAEIADSAAEEAGLADTLIYLMSASLAVPLDKDGVELYLYCLNKYFEKHLGMKVPEELRKTELDDHRAELLRDLRQWIYKKQMAGVKEAEKKTPKEER